MRKKFIFWASIFCLIALISSFSFFYFTKRGIFAASSDNTIGWAWSENIGWISLNIFNDYNNDGVLDDHGSSSWNKPYDSSRNDFAMGVAVDLNNNVIVAGYKSNGTNNDYYIIKYDSNGNPVGGNWPVTYNSGSGDVAYGVAVDGNNNVVVTGISNNNILTIKYNSNGDPVSDWPKIYDSGFYDQGSGVAIDSNNNIIVTGYGGSSYDYITIKYDPDGNPLWTPAFITYDSGGTNDRAQAVAVDSNNNIIVTGRGSRPGYPTATDFMTLKYDSNGNLLSGWPVFYNSGSNDYAYGVAVDSSDNIIVAGYNTISSNVNYYTIKYDSIGNPLWDATYDGGLGSDAVRGVAVDSNDNIIVAGYVNTTNPNYHTIKYNLTSAGYGVGINIVYPTGEVQGYAWSENIGWIQFNPVGPYPGSPNNSVHYDFNTKELSGWAKIINSGDNGWVKLQGPAESVPPQYNLCRGCVGVYPDKTCDLCYESIETDSNGKQYGADRVGTQCSVCSDDDNTCRICSNNYRYGVSVISYDLGSDGVRKILEGWAYNDATVGWIHFNYAYAYAPLAFDNFSVSLTTVPPVNTCKSVDLSWESSSWANSYEIWKDSGSAASQDCSTAVYSFSSASDVSICSDGSCAAQDSTLSENTYYCFKIKAVNDYGSTYCANNTPTNPCPKQVKTPLCAPDDFTADGKTCGEINLSWTDKSNETKYNIYHSLINVDATSSATLIDTLEATPDTIPPATITYEDKSVISGQTYYYLLTAGSNSGDESPIAQTNGKTQCYKGPKFEEK